MQNLRPIIGITMGDPAGIGPEIIVKALSQTEIYTLCRPLVIGDAEVMRHAVRVAGTASPIHSVSSVADATFIPGRIDVFDLAMAGAAQTIYGEISAVAGCAAFRSIEKVIELAMARDIEATVTGPIQKEAITRAGFLAAFMARLVERVIKIEFVNEMFIEGGSSASAIVRQLGWNRFTPRWEIAPGVVRLQVTDQPHVFMTVKPGSYSWPEFFWECKGASATPKSICRDQGTFIGL